MIRYIKNIDILFPISIYRIVLYRRKKCQECKTYILIILKISISISIMQYFQNIASLSYRNWNPDIKSSLV